MPNAGTNTWKPLKNLSYVLDNYALLNNTFLWPQIYKQMTVMEEAGRHYQTDKRNTMRVYPIARTINGGFNRIQFGFGKNKYALTEYGLEIQYDETWLKRYRNTPFGGLAYGAMLIKDSIALSRERACADEFNQSTTFWPANQVEAADKKFWEDDFNPQKWFATKRMEIRKSKSPEPNTLICSKAVYDWLKMNPYVKADLSSEGAGQSVVAADITMSRMCAVLGVERILIGNASVNEAPAGYQGAPEESDDIDTPLQPNEPSMRELWPDDNIFLGYLNPGPARLGEVTFGHYLEWGAYGMGAGTIVESYKEPQNVSVVLRVRGYGGFVPTGKVHWRKFTGIWGDGPT